MKSIEKNDVITNYAISYSDITLYTSTTDFETGKANLKVTPASTTDVCETYEIEPGYYRLRVTDGVETREYYLRIQEN